MTLVLDEILQHLNIELKYFPPNATHLIQPSDSFVIQAIKAEWVKLWYTKKIRNILDAANGAVPSNTIFSEGKGGSGRLLNPGKH